MAILCLFGNQAWAQRSSIFTDPAASYTYGLELFRKEKFVAAQNHFQKILITFPDNIPTANKTVLEGAELYSAFCGIELDQPDAGVQVERFLENNPGSMYTAVAGFYLLKNYFQKSKYAEVIATNSRYDLSGLDAEQSVAVKYYLGYSYFARKDFATAKRNFIEIKDTKTTFKYPANYYLGHIYFTEKSFDKALPIFEELAESKNYGKIAPYYIVQIYYAQGKFDKVIEYGIPKATDKNLRNSAEFNLLIGQAYFQKKEYAMALPYLQRYRSGGGKMGPTEYYQLGYAAYLAKDCDLAIKSFEPIAANNDSLGQGATLLMANCLLQDGKKQEARTAYLKASKSSFDKAIAEDAAFQYAKLSYDLNVQTASLSALKSFIADYPKSKKADEAKGLLSDLLLVSNNSKEALEILETIENKTWTIKRTYQKVALKRALELFGSGKWEESLANLNKSLTYPIDASYQAEALFWKMETQFKLNSFAGAQESGKLFLSALNGKVKVAQNTNAAFANYTLGYANLKTSNYKTALNYFEASLTSFNNLPANLKTQRLYQNAFNDLLVRTGDAHFAGNNYVAATDFYNRAINQNANNQDYLIFQKAVISGLQGKYNEKITLIRELNSKFPNSGYADLATMELVNYYFVNDQLEEALSEVEKIVVKTNSSQNAAALLTKGLILYNQSKYDNSIAAYKVVVAKYPKSQEFNDALKGIEQNYIAKNDVDAYFSYVKTLPSGSISTTAQDSITYQSADLAYGSGDCTKGINELTRYISRFPEGYFIAEARFNRADCYYRTKQTDLALADYEFVIQQNNTTFLERSLVRASEIRYVRKEYDKAFALYDVLEQKAFSKSNKTIAQLGKARIASIQEKHDLALTNARLLVDQAGLSQEILQEVNLIMGRAKLAKNQLPEAFADLKKAYDVNKNEFAAEAKYTMAKIQFLQGDQNATQASVLELVDKIPFFDLWSAKSFILLADSYTAQQNYFQARVTLESVIENYNIADIKREAELKLVELKKLEGK